MKVYLFLLATALTLMPSLMRGSSERGFYADFSRCTEFAGVGPVDFARASALVPQVFTTLTVALRAALWFAPPTYQFTYDSSGKAGELYVEVEGLGLPAYFLSGTETDPTVPGSDFKANWWYATSREVVKQASDFPDIAFGTSSISLHTDRNSFLGKLIGGNTDSDYHFLPVRGVYASAHAVNRRDSLDAANSSVSRGIFAAAPAFHCCFV